MGQLGEDAALKHLQNKGYRLIERNYHTRFGELDLILEAPDKTLVFVEVKARMKSKFGSPLEQISSVKSAHLMKAAARYLNERGGEEKSCRMDAVGLEYEIDPEGDRIEKPVIKHLENITGWQ